MPSRAAHIDGNYRVVERVLDGDYVHYGKWWRLCLIGVDTPEIKHPRKPVSTSEKRLPRLHNGWWKGSGCGFSLTWQMYDGLTRTTGNRGARLAYVFSEDGALLNAAKFDERFSATRMARNYVAIYEPLIND